jgi:hypothetical protein
MARSRGGARAAASSGKPSQRRCGIASRDGPGRKKARPERQDRASGGPSGVSHDPLSRLSVGRLALPVGNAKYSIRAMLPRNLLSEPRQNPDPGRRADIGVVWHVGRFLPPRDGRKAQSTGRRLWRLRLTTPSSPAPPAASARSGPTPEPASGGRRRRPRGPG